MKVVLSLVMLLSSSVSHAFDRDDAMHLAAHTGASFALQTGFYGVNSRWLGMDRDIATLVAVLETLAIGMAWKASEGFPENTTTSMMQNGMGVVGAMAVQFEFDF